MKNIKELWQRLSIHRSILFKVSISLAFLGLVNQLVSVGIQMINAPDTLSVNIGIQCLLLSIFLISTLITILFYQSKKNEK